MRGWLHQCNFKALCQAFSRESRVPLVSLVSIVPGVSLLLCAIPMFFYEISGNKKKEMQKALAAKREADGFTVAE